MGKIIIQDMTVKNPITLIGKEAGICYGANTMDDVKNFNRGLDCIENNHGRTLEFPDVYMIIDGYSARVIREWYTHIGGSPTRLQASTRYIDYSDFKYIIPPSVSKHDFTEEKYIEVMQAISKCAKTLERAGVPREDIGLILPLGMTTKIVCKHNFRNLMDMSRQRLCNRAYWEYRQLYSDLMQALREYSEEWKILVDKCLYAKCELNHICLEKNGCGRYPHTEKI